MRLWTALKTLLGLASLLAIAAADSAAPFHGISVAVLLFEFDGGKPTSFTPSLEIPLKPGGQVWGWDLKIDSAAPDQKIHLVQELSVAAPATWGEPGKGVEISPDQKTWKKTSDVTLKERHYVELMKSDDADPPGPGMLTLTIDGMRMPGLTINFIPVTEAKPK